MQPDGRRCLFSWCSSHCYFACVAVERRLLSLPHSPVCNVCPAGSAVVLQSPWALQRQKEATVDPTHIQLPRAFLAAWRGAALLRDLLLASVPLLQVNANHYSSPPFRTSNIHPQQEIMNPTLKRQLSPEKWLQTKNCTFTTRVLVRRISTSKILYHQDYCFSVFTCIGWPHQLFSVCVHGKGNWTHTHHQENLFILSEF